MAPASLTRPLPRPSHWSRAAALLAVPLLLLACGETTEIPAEPEPMETLPPMPPEVPVQYEDTEIDTVSLGGCGGAVARPFLFQRADERTRAAIEDASAPNHPIRWVPEDEADTSNIDPTRLTVVLDEDGVITALECR